MRALTDNGFVVPKALDRPSNLDLTKYYDQIAFKTDPSVIEFIDRASRNPKNANAGIFELFQSVFRPEDFAQYSEAAGKSSNGKGLSAASLNQYYGDWKTYQMSDHKPMWARVNSNSATDYLDSL